MSPSSLDSSDSTTMLLLFAFLSVLLAAVHGGFYIGQTVNCDFTYYNDAGYGACGNQINAAWENLVAVAPPYWSTPNPNNDPVCRNVCIRVDYNGKSRTMPVKDKCPSCNANHFDLSQAAFQFFAPTSVGHIWGATCTFVNC
ncbi:hypothetical protein L596_023317 [Steinernema carpocapsae]|uniref:RlpA-like protein double-psi beta-barrel domain-containing protein n=1 Tax=Steinernema carpocapsae TaxID=34508 RepID=A0A4V5ZZD5_STECR|nr:hypothetical protein L596_023317 [Steinernema carpocapsae]